MIGDAAGRPDAPGDPEPGTAAPAGPRSNSDVVQGLYQALAERNLGALSAATDPAIEIHQSEALPWGGTYRGRDGFHRFFGAVLHHLDSTVVIERLIEAGNQVAVVGHARGTVRANGCTFDVPLVHLYELRGHRVVRAAILIDTPAMLQALNG